MPEAVDSSHIEGLQRKIVLIRFASNNINHSVRGIFVTLLIEHKLRLITGAGLRGAVFTVSFAHVTCVWVEAPHLTDQCFQCFGVPHRITFAIIIKIDKDVASLPIPFKDPLRPPTQIVIGIRAAVKVLLVRAMQARIDEICCCPQQTRKMCPAHDAICGSMLLQEIEHRILVPRRVTKLETYPQPGRYLFKEILETRVVVLVQRRKLHEQDSQAIPQKQKALLNTLKPALRLE